MRAPGGERHATRAGTSMNATTRTALAGLALTFVTSAEGQVCTPHDAIRAAASRNEGTRIGGGWRQIPDVRLEEVDGRVHRMSAVVHQSRDGRTRVALLCTPDAIAFTLDVPLRGFDEIRRARTRSARGTHEVTLVPIMECQAYVAQWRRGEIRNALAWLGAAARHGIEFEQARGDWSASRALPGSKSAKRAVQACAHAAGWKSTRRNEE